MWATVNVPRSERQRMAEAQGESEEQREARLQKNLEVAWQEQVKLQREEVEKAADKSASSLLVICGRGPAMEGSEAGWRRIEQSYLGLMKELKKSTFDDELRWTVTRKLSLVREKLKDYQGALLAAHSAACMKEDVGMWMRVLRISREKHWPDPGVTYADKTMAVRRAGMAWEAAKRIKLLREKRGDNREEIEKHVGKEVVGELMTEFFTRSTRIIAKFPQGPYGMAARCSGKTWPQLGECLLGAYRQMLKRNHPLLAVSLDNVRITVVFVVAPPPPPQPQKKRSISSSPSVSSPVRKSARQRKKSTDRVERENAEFTAAIVGSTPSLRLMEKVGDLRDDAELVSKPSLLPPPPPSPKKEEVPEAKEKGLSSFHERWCKGTECVTKIAAAWLEAADLSEEKTRKTAEKLLEIVESDPSLVTPSVRILACELFHSLGKVDECKQRLANLSPAFSTSQPHGPVAEEFGILTADLLCVERIQDRVIELRFLWLWSYYWDNKLEKAVNELGEDEQIGVFYDDKLKISKAAFAQRHVEKTEKQRLEGSTRRFREIVGGGESVDDDLLWNEIYDRIATLSPPPSPPSTSLFVPTVVRDVKALVGSSKETSALVAAAKSCEDSYERADLCLQLCVAALEEEEKAPSWIAETLRDVLALGNAEECVQALESRLVECVDKLARRNQSTAVLGLEIADSVDSMTHSKTARQAYLGACLELKRNFDAASRLVREGVPCARRTALAGVLDLVDGNVNKNDRARALSLACDLVGDNADFAKEAHALLAEKDACDGANSVFLKRRIESLRSQKTRQAQLVTAQCYCCLFGIKALTGATETHPTKKRTPDKNLEDVVHFLAPHVLRKGKRDDDDYLVAPVTRRDLLATLDFVVQRDPDLVKKNLDPKVTSYLFQGASLSLKATDGSTAPPATKREEARRVLAEMMMSKLDARVEATSQPADPRREEARLDSVSWQLRALSYSPTRVDLWASLGRCLDDLAGPLLAFGPIDGFVKHTPVDLQPYITTNFGDTVAVHDFASRTPSGPWSKHPEFGDAWLASLAAAFADARRLAARRAHAVAAPSSRSASLALACSMYDGLRELKWSSRATTNAQLIDACAAACRRHYKSFSSPSEAEQADPPAWFEDWLLGKLAWRSGDASTALACFERAARSGNPEAIYRLARTKFKVGGADRQSIAESMRLCLKNDPRHARSALGLADCLDETDALGARRALEPLFDKRRSQVVALWRYENSNGLDRLDASPRKYDRLRLKYLRRYVGLIDPERLQTLYAQIASTKERSRCVAAMQLNTLEARLKSAPETLELATQTYRDAAKLVDDPLFLEKADVVRAQVAIADAALCNQTRREGNVFPSDANAPVVLSLLAARKEQAAAKKLKTEQDNAASAGSAQPASQDGAPPTDDSGGSAGNGPSDASAAASIPQPQGPVTLNQNQSLGPSQMQGVITPTPVDAQNPRVTSIALPPRPEATTASTMIEDVEMAPAHAETLDAKRQVQPCHVAEATRPPNVNTMPETSAEMTQRVSAMPVRETTEMPGSLSASSTVPAQLTREETTKRQAQPLDARSTAGVTPPHSTSSSEPPPPHVPSSSLGGAASQKEKERAASVPSNGELPGAPSKDDEEMPPAA